MGKNEELDSKLQQTGGFYLVIKRTLDEEEAGYWGANWCRGQEEHAPGINGTWKWTGRMKWIAKNTLPSVFNKGRQLIVTCPAESRNVRGWTSYFLTGVKGLAFEAG